MISFLIADDHEITRMGVISYIKESFGSFSVEEAENGDEVFEKLKHNNFDVLITDINMPGTDIHRMIEMALIMRPALKILILSMNKEELFAGSFLKKGAMGYLEKNASGTEISNAIRVIISGNIYMSPSIAKAMINSKGSINANPFQQLSDREMQVCGLLCEGLSLKEIGNNLNLAISTISTNKIRILAKMNVTNMVDLVKMWEIHHL